MKVNNSVIVKRSNSLSVCRNTICRMPSSINSIPARIRKTYSRQFGLWLSCYPQNRNAPMCNCWKITIPTTVTSAHVISSWSIRRLLTKNPPDILHGRLITRAPHYRSTAHVPAESADKIIRFVLLCHLFCHYFATELRARTETDKDISATVDLSGLQTSDWFDKIKHCVRTIMSPQSPVKNWMI